MKSKGVLYIVSTPIGNLADITYRAVEVLRQVDMIAAEDTRHSKHLLENYQITKPMISVHEHNEESRVTIIIGYLAEGKDIALISDAGTPLINDPGYRLVRAVKSEGFDVVPLPGPCALIAALSVSGLPTDQFHFLGFLPVKATARKEYLTLFTESSATLICYEAPHRLLYLIQDIAEVMGSQREVCLARELTKKFETIRTAPAAELLAWIKQDVNQQKGECVVLIDGQSRTEKKQEFKALDSPTRDLLVALVEFMPPKKAASIVAQFQKIPKQTLYDFLIHRKNIVNPE